MSLLKDFQSSARAAGALATTAIVVTWIVLFLLFFLKVLSMPVAVNFVFSTDAALTRPWTALTYPFASWEGQVLGLIFACLWFWGIGGSVERELATPKFVGIFFLFAFLCAAFLFAGSMLVSEPAVMIGPWVLLSTFTVIWGTRNPEVDVLFMFVVKLKAKYLAWLSAALVIFNVTPPAMAAFAAIPLILAYFFAKDRLPVLAYSRGGTVSFKRERKVEETGRGKVVREGYFDDVKRREKEREERERLRKLFEDSIGDDDRR